MITQLDNQSWSKELVTGNAQFIETAGGVVYIVSQVRADNTFAVFKSLPAPPQPGPGFVFEITATHLFPTVDGNNNSSFDPVVAYDEPNQMIYIVGTQDAASGEGTDVLFFPYNTSTDTLGAPFILVTASYVRDSYDVCILGDHQFIAVAVTNPSQIWQTPTVADVTNISISPNGETLTATASNAFLDGQQITFSGLQNAIFLNSIAVNLTNSSGSQFVSDYSTQSPPAAPWLPNYADGYTQVGYESGYATWLPGHSLLGFEMNGSSLVGITVLDSSPFRSGNTFGAVSTYSPDGSSIEVYYEAHPKLITFTDQIFNLNVAYRNGGVWQLPSTTLKTFTGRYADARLTVIPSGNNRTLLQQYFSQLVHQNALVGNLLLGYFNGSGSPPSWAFHVQPGSVTTSYIQGTLSVAETAGTFVSFLAEPVYDIRGEWSPQVKTYNVNDKIRYNSTDYYVNQTISYLYQGSWSAYVFYAANAVVQVALPTDPVTYGYYTAINPVYFSTLSPNLDTTNWVATPTPNIDSRFSLVPTSWSLQTNSLDTSTFNLSNIPGFYNNLSFTWLRGSKSVLDDQTKWGVVGEQVGANSGATYVSDFDVAPVVNLVPSSGSSVTVYRAQPYVLNASGTNDGNLDPVTFFWTYAVDPTGQNNANVTITPSPSGSTATLLVKRAIGGAEEQLIVGVVATTADHLPMTITSIGITGNVLTVHTLDDVSLASGESVFLYDIAAAEFLNDLVVVANANASGTSFTANYTYSGTYPTTADTGSAIANAQFAYVDVTVPFNAAPTITFPVNPISAARNSMMEIIPTYTGVTDPDDATTYSWTQISGTTIPTNQIISGTNSATLEFDTNGVLIEGDTLVWSLTVNDGVNAPVTSMVTVNVAPYPFQIRDTLQLSRSVWGGNISQRNSIQDWGPLDVSVLYTNFQNIKRTSVLDGTDRYIVISPASVMVFGGISPDVILLRKLFVPINGLGVQNAVIDAVHTEDDYTLVLDSAGYLYRYSTAPLINTDNPDTTINLNDISLMTFNKVFATYSFGNVRVIVLTGPDGCMFLQLRNTDLAVQGDLQFSVGSGMLYGADNVQFVRTSNVESLSTGKVLLGSIADVVVNITSITIANNVVTVEAVNTFSVVEDTNTANQYVIFSNLTGATFLNGVTAALVSATPSAFVISFEHADYATTPEGANAIATSGGKTYETLIDLAFGQIIGTWDASKLRNQYVTTGEILFEPNDTYAGVPAAPVMNPVVNSGAVTGRPGYVNLVVSWVADRPDLISAYDLEISSDSVNWTVYPVNSGYIESVTLPEPLGQQFYFRVQALGVDGNSPYSNIVTINTSVTPPSAAGFGGSFAQQFAS